MEIVDAAERLTALLQVGGGYAIAVIEGFVIWRMARYITGLHTQIFDLLWRRQTELVSIVRRKVALPPSPDEEEGT